MTSEYDTSDVRIIRTDDLSVNPYVIVETAQRTPAQKHTDFALQSALDLQNDALEAAEGAVEWLASIGADIPRRLRDIPVELGQLGRFIKDEQGRRG